MMRSDTATRGFAVHFRSLRTLRVLAALLACYALAGVAWWNTLGCLPPTAPGIVTASASPPGAGSVTIACNRTDGSGNALGCPLPGGPLIPGTGSGYTACLTASAPAFSTWSGCTCQIGSITFGCDGPNQCSLHVLDGTQIDCVANFCDAFELSVEVIGTGKVESHPAGIECERGICRSSFCDFAGPGIVPTIALRATERLGSGQVFAGWEGDPDCDDGVVSLDADKSCLALFRAPALSVSTTGAGSVTGLPGLACRENSLPAECESSAPLASYVTLYADPDPAAQLMAWGGDCPDGQTSSQFVMTGDLSCTATFSAPGAGGGGVIEIVSLADDESLGDLPVDIAESELSGSADLSVVAFRSGATNLTGAPEPTWRAYARDREAGTTQAITGPAWFSPMAVSLSADGLFGAYEDAVPDPVVGYVFDVYRRDLRSDTEELISVDFPAPPNGLSPLPAISGNGRFVAYWAEIAGGRQGIVVRDTCSGAAPAEACSPHSAVVSYDVDGVLLGGPGGPPRINRDGRFVLILGYTRTGSGPTLFLHDRDSDVDGLFDEAGFATTIVAAPDPSGGVLELHWDPRYDLDASGRYVAFQSPDPDLPGTGGTSAFARSFLRDTCAGAPAGCVPSYSMLTVRQDGTPVDDSEQTLLSDLSGSGRYAMFYTTDALLVGSTPGAFGGTFPSVLRDTCVGAPAGCTPGNVLVSRLGTGSPLPVSSYMPRVSDDGGAAVFFGQRGAAVAATAEPGFAEVLFTTTGIVPDPGLTPAISGRSPASVPAGSPELLLTLTGGDFAPAAGVLWNGVARPAIFISPQRLQIRLSAGDVATAGVSTVRVVNPGGLTSSQVSFRVN